MSREVADEIARLADRLTFASDHRLSDFGLHVKALHEDLAKKLDRIENDSDAASHKSSNSVVTVEACPSCSQRLRIPTNRGRLSLTCPKCRSTWEWVPTVDEAINTLEDDNARIQAELSRLAEYLRAGNHKEAVASREQLDKMLLDYPEAFNYSLQALFSLYEMEMDGELPLLGSPNPRITTEEPGDNPRNSSEITSGCSTISCAKEKQTKETKPKSLSSYPMMEDLYKKDSEPNATKIVHKP